MNPPAIPEDEYVMISALQHWLYCPRQCGLIHLERAWAENRFTAEGKVMHERAHDGPDESRPGIRITRSLSVKSARLGLVGQCDIVEFHEHDECIVPVEYKRGKPKPHRADEVQLCAQAICLEEMLDRSPGTIETGYLFYGKRKRRTEVALDDELRALTENLTLSIHRMFSDGVTPGAEYKPSLCDACSLIELCSPLSLRFKRGAGAWFERQISQSPG